MSLRTAMVESMEQMGEHHSRSGQPPQPEDALMRALQRHPNDDAILNAELLLLRYWMHYAAGVSQPEEATDVTLRNWLR